MSVLSSSSFAVMWISLPGHATTDIAHLHDSNDLPIQFAA